MARVPSDSFIMLNLYAKAGEHELIGRPTQPGLVNIDTIESITSHQTGSQSEPEPIIHFTRIRFVSGKTLACSDSLHDISERLFSMLPAD